MRLWPILALVPCVALAQGYGGLHVGKYREDASTIVSSPLNPANPGVNLGTGGGTAAITGTENSTDGGVPHLVFNGSSDVVAHSGLRGLLSGSYGRTVSYRAYTADSEANSQYFLSTPAPAVTNSYGNWMPSFSLLDVGDGNKMILDISTLTSHALLYTNGIMSSNTWYRDVVAYDAGGDLMSLRMFRDAGDVLCIDTAHDVTAPDTIESDTMDLGRANIGGTDYWFKGGLCRVKYAVRAWTAAEMQRETVRLGIKSYRE